VSKIQARNSKTILYIAVLTISSCPASAGLFISSRETSGTQPAADGCLRMPKEPIYRPTRVPMQPDNPPLNEPETPKEPVQPPPADPNEDRPMQDPLPPDSDLPRS